MRVASSHSCASVRVMRAGLGRRRLRLAAAAAAAAPSPPAGPYPIDSAPPWTLILGPPAAPRRRRQRADAASSAAGPAEAFVGQFDRDMTAQRGVLAALPPPRLAVPVAGLSGSPRASGWRAVAAAGAPWRRLACCGGGWRRQARCGGGRRAAATAGGGWRAVAAAGAPWRRLARPASLWACGVSTPAVLRAGQSPAARGCSGCVRVDALFRGRAHALCRRLRGRVSWSAALQRLHAKAPGCEAASRGAAALRRLHAKAPGCEAASGGAAAAAR
jgi:hypothetical protein